MGITTETPARPTGQAHELPVESPIDAMPKGYEYTHADGIVHHAENAEIARAACPVLGKLAVGQADLLLEVAALGQQKMKEEQQKPKPEEKTDVKKHIEPEREKQNTKSEPKTQTGLEAVKQSAEQKQTIKPSHVANILQAKQNTQQQQQQIELLKKERIKIETPVTGGLPSHTPESIDAGQPQTNVEATIKPQTEAISTTKSEPSKITSTEQSVILANAQRYEAKAKLNIVEEPEATQTAVQIAEAETPSVVVVTPEAVTVFATNKVDETIIEAPPEMGLLDDIESIEAELLTEDNVFDYAAENAVLDESEIQLHLIDPTSVATEVSTDFEVDTDADKQLELLYEPETIETYHELSAISADMKADQAVLDQSTTTEEGVNVLVAVDAYIEDEATDFYIKDTHDFEAFIDEQPKIEEPITLEVIQDQAANEQPLEQTFIQFVGVISDTETLSEQTELYVILKDIEAALPACYTDQKERPQIHITPEMTEKLLMLLRQLGHEHPRGSLVEFVGQYSLAFLLQTLQYMCQLNSEEYRKEFLTNTFVISIDDNSSRVRLSMLLASLAINKPRFARI